MDANVMGSLAIQRQWVSALHESPEVGQTSAMLKVILGNHVVTRNEDEWSRTIRDEVRLSAYPLALWFASSWWRLRWEPLPLSTPSSSWRMAHELSAAGYGYLWPRMLFAADGENMHIWATQSAPDSKAAVRYLSDSYHELTTTSFERTVDEFVGGVIARLDAVGLERTALHELWAELAQERGDKALASHRRFEAMLGFDPDECPDDLLSRFESLIPEAGAAAAAEIASICASANPASTLEKVVAFAKGEGLKGRIDLSLPTDGTATDADAPVWRRGRDLAKQARDALRLNGSTVTDDLLCDLVNLPRNQAFTVDSMARPPLGIAIRAGQSADLRFLLRKRNRPGRRFELARFLCDYLIADRTDTWLPITDAKTARQKIQRAFAAEFLCPIEPLTKLLSGDHSQDAIDEAAEHFGVAEMAVKTQLVNNTLLPPDILANHGSGFDFPYLTNSNRPQASAFEQL